LASLNHLTVPCAMKNYSLKKTQNQSVKQTRACLCSKFATAAEIAKRWFKCPSELPNEAAVILQKQTRWAFYAL
ncbi:MAG: hypothetical protein KUL75_07305, partial [Sterolibacterium sp.]|nr:hypothetical protein [Sterolibacterium sp.]